MRLQKYLSECGVCSRRRAEERIAGGRVTVNGVTAQLGQSVDETRDEVYVDGKPVTPGAERTYVMLHKPRGYVTTLRDPQGRPTVAELVSDVPARLYPVGRLDLQSEGLLLLTDDGETANYLAHPSHGVEKTYRVWVRGDDISGALSRLNEPIAWQGVTYRGAKIEIRRQSAHRACADFTISEGKNREIRNMCAAVGLRVERLVRLRQGELILGDLPVGKWRYLRPNEIRYLRRLRGSQGKTDAT